MLLEQVTAFWFVSKQVRNGKQSEDEDGRGSITFLGNV
jgi:hypothetical protein